MESAESNSILQKSKNPFFAATKACELQTTIGVRFPVCALNLTDTNVEQM